MIRTWVRVLVLIAVFLLSILISFLITSQRFDDPIITPGNPTLPRISFNVGGERVNNLFGYVEEMEITTMRDVITPLGVNGLLTMMVESNNNRIESISYQLFTLNGETLLASGYAGLLDDNLAHIDLQEYLTPEVLGDNQREAALRIILSTEARDIFYYTRVIRNENLNINELLSFSRDFHQNTLGELTADELEAFLAPGANVLNNGFQSVTLNSDMRRLQWGDIQPEILGEVEWSIHETNTVYSSILATYQVVSNAGESNGAVFNVREFFRIRLIDDIVFMQIYNRTMNQIFTVDVDTICNDGIHLGLTPNDLTYKTCVENNVVAFVQERSLWIYNKYYNTLSLAFSFSDGQNNDRRSNNDNHEIKIISVEENGNTAFAVLGYMNRGEHEGRVGVAFYYYDKGTNSIEEKAFISANRHFRVTLDELGGLVYYSLEQDMLYFKAGRNLYQLNTITNIKTEIATNLERGQFASSDDGKYFAWQADGDINSSTTLNIKNLRTGERYNVSAPDGANIRPLGFINHDLIYGFSRPGDMGVSTVGESINPVYRLEIMDTNREVAKAYQVNQVFIESIIVQENQITLNRLVKDGEVYSPTSQYFIIYLQETLDNEVFLEQIGAQPIDVATRITFNQGLEGSRPRVLRAQQMMGDMPLNVIVEEVPREGNFYVYALGRLIGVYQHAALAIDTADSLFGVVVNSSQNYVWERGNRFLVFDTFVEPFQAEEDQTSLGALEEFMGAKGAQRIDFTGSRLEDLLYVINRGLPMIGVLGEDSGVLFIRYTIDTITYLDPTTGGTSTVTIREMSERMDSHGNVFIGFIP